MSEQGVDRFVALNITVSPKTERHVNDFAISLLQYPNVIPFGSVHPDSENALSELSRLQKAGVKGIKFHNEYQGFFVDDGKGMRIYEECVRLGLIMLFHGGADRGFSPPVKTPPARMRKVAQAFPEGKFVVAHLGGQDMIGDAVEYLSDTNVMIDVSFSSRTAAPDAAEACIRAFGFDRVLFGTDCPWDTPESTLAFLSGMHFTQEEMRRICEKNALRLLGEG